MFLPLYVGVSAWQFGQSKRRLISSLLELLPSMWSNSKGIGTFNHEDK